MSESSSRFLDVKSGDYVLVESELPRRQYIGYILNCVCGSTDPINWTLFQIADIDTGIIEIVHSGYIVEIILSANDS